MSHRDFDELRQELNAVSKTRVRLIYVTLRIRTWIASRLARLINKMCPHAFCHVLPYQDETGFVQYIELCSTCRAFIAAHHNIR